MTDVYDPPKRSQVMAGIRGRGNRSTELAMVAVLRDSGVKGWRRHVKLRPRLSAVDAALATKRNAGRILTRPDFIFRPSKVALFVDGCFWHGCPLHSTTPAQNALFWAKKLGANVGRDAVHTRALESAGWKVLRVWEHELSDPETLTSHVLNLLRKTHASGDQTNTPMQRSTSCPPAAA